MANELPAYIERPTGYDLALAGPYHLRGISARAYVLRADKQALQATCDRYLNLPQQAERYSPLAGVVVLVTLNVDKITAGDESLGSMHEIDCGFLLPVLERRDGGVIPTALAAFAPYLWVNNEWPAITGREVLGYRKEVGTSFTNGDDESAQSGADLQHIEGWVIPSPGDKLVRRRLVDIDPESLATASDGEWSNAVEAFEGVLGSAVLAFPEAIAAAFVQGVLGISNLSLNGVFLKQFRAEGTGLQQRACYQRVFLAEARVHMDSLRGGLLPGQHNVKVTSYASHPLALELGLGNMGPGVQTIPAAFAFEARMDFDMLLP